MSSGAVSVVCRQYRRCTRINSTEPSRLSAPPLTVVELRAADISVNHPMINDAVEWNWECSASVQDPITASNNISSFTRMSEWTCSTDKGMQWLNSCLQPQKPNTGGWHESRPLLSPSKGWLLGSVCCLLLFLPAEEIWSLKRGRGRNAGEGSVGELSVCVGYNILQRRSRESKAMSCWLFNKLQAHTALCS